MIYEYLTFTIHRLQAVTWQSFLLALLAVFIAWLVYKIIEERLSPLAKIPSPEGSLPLIGHVLVLIKKGGLPPLAIEWRGKYGPIVSVNPGFGIGRGGQCVLVFDKDLIKQVLVTDSYKFNRDQLIKDALPGVGNGLFGSNGKTHARQRKMINPAFSFTNLKTFVPAFVESAAELVEDEKWQPSFVSKKLLYSIIIKGRGLGKEEDTLPIPSPLWTKKIEISPIVEVDDDICHLTLDIIGKTSFGYGFNTVLGQESEVSTAFNSLLTGTEFSYLVRSKIIPFYKYLPFPDNLAIKKSTKLVDDTVLKVCLSITFLLGYLRALGCLLSYLQTERFLFDLQVIQERGMFQGKAADHKDLLNLLLDMYDEETGKGFDDEELRAQVFTFMVAGHETTSTSMSWTLYELAKHPEIQDKIRKEIKDVLKDDDDLTWNKLEQLEYLGCVIKESLRLNAPVEVLGRETNQTLVLGGYEIPKGTPVFSAFGSLHLSPDIWENPLEFIPERFMRNDNSPVSPYSFLPFSIGPRTCIGNKFAMIEMKTILLSLMRKFKFTAIPGFKVKKLTRLTIKPDPSVKVKITLMA
ncbi:hypothetical protein QZH41_017300 [Actinostola sp. cb2023]|nr:hypothetical protein QZH41_017300 [Actinostola sp. cb2023]